LAQGAGLARAQPGRTLFGARKKIRRKKGRARRRTLVRARAKTDPEGESREDISRESFRGSLSTINERRWNNAYKPGFFGFKKASRILFSKTLDRDAIKCYFYLIS
jgi:hypothetical protein